MSKHASSRVSGTRLQWILAGWIGITAFVALNRGVDLLWGVVILLVIACATAAALPKLQLLGVRVRRLQFPATAVVGESQRIGYEIDASAPLPRYDLEIHERLNNVDWTLAAFIPQTRGSRQAFFIWTPQQRGCWRLSKLRLECGFPLGLLRAGRSFGTTEHEIVVYPDFAQLYWLPIHGDARGTTEHAQSAQRGGHGEFFALRPYAPGDEARRVHWRASARLGEVLTREYERLEGRQLWIVLELAASMHIGTGRDGTCEQMIRIAHSAIVKAHADGIPVGLLYRVADAIQCIPAAADRATYQRLRDTLARVEAHPQVPLYGWLQRFREQLPTGGTWLLFNLAGEIERAALQAAARDNSATPLLVELDAESFARREPAEKTQPVTLRTEAGIVSIVPYAADLTGLFRP